MSFKLIVKLAAPAVLSVALLGACGSEETASADVPSLSGDDGAAATTTTPIDAEEAAQQFVACVREEGIDVADPEVGQDGAVDLRSIFESADVDPRSDEFREVQDACGDLLADAGLGRNDDQQAERQESTLAFSACLRGEGLEVSDLAAGGPGGGGGAGGEAPAADGGTPPSRPERGGGQGSEADRTTFLAEAMGLDPEDPEVTAAFETCSDELTAATERPGQATDTTEG